MEPTRTYSLDRVDQYQCTSDQDMVPADDDLALALAQAIAFEATLYGVPAALQYAQLCEQALGGSDGPVLGLNTFRHADGIAGPEHAAFRVPNVDTLYSNAWFDLTESPVQLSLPDFGDRYFTLNLLDMHGNASNISIRTHGRGPHKILLALSSWDGEIPHGYSLFRVATAITWGLLRVQVTGGADAEFVRARQRDVTVDGLQTGLTTRLLPVVTPAAVEEGWEAFMTALHAVIAICGVPVEEQALVHRFRTIGVGLGDRFSPSSLSEPVREGVRRGYELAFTLMRGSRAQLGSPAGGGWTRVANKGRHGLNYTSRAVMNLVGLAANVVEENTSFNTFVDSEAMPLSGDRGDFELVFWSLPPVEYFWSLTLYEVDTGQVYGNDLDRYSVGSATSLHSEPDGAIVVRVQHARPREGNWLPSPRGPFFLVLRAYGPREGMLRGDWSPPALRFVGGRAGETPAGTLETGPGAAR